MNLEETMKDLVTKGLDFVKMDTQYGSYVKAIIVVLYHFDKDGNSIEREEK